MKQKKNNFTQQNQRREPTLRCRMSLVARCTFFCVDFTQILHTMTPTYTVTLYTDNNNNSDSNSRK